MTDTGPQPVSIDDRLKRVLSQVERQCRNCHACVKHCPFLQTYGSPATIASQARCSAFPLESAFACNLCQLCTATCRHQVAPGELFLELRRACVRNGQGLFPEHDNLTEFEKTGTSKRHTWAGLPFGSRRIFFPGCNLSGSRPQLVRKVFEILQQVFPDIGIALDCCSKPSHDLGRDRSFRALFGELRGWLLDAGVEEVLTACPGCQQIFDQYGGGLRVRTMYEALLDNPALVPRVADATPVKLHDPCAARFAAGTQQAVRELARLMGLEISEMPHHGPATLCCGKGGGAHRYAPSMSSHWLEQLNGEAGFTTTVTYCGSCQARFHDTFKTSHLLDFLVHPQHAAAGDIKPPSATMFNLNRLRLKLYFRRHLDISRQRERTLGYPQPG